MRAPVFMTGATGFLGMEVLARLLDAGERDVVCLVRAADRGAAEARLDGVLETLWADPAPYRGRVRAVAGDLTSPGLGIDPAERTALAEEVGAVLHCAASITFDLPLEEARAINVEGTREMIGFAREAKARGRLERFLHVSTAYVAGAYPGTFGERQLVAGQEFRNTYEQTKWEAEQLVAAADDLAPAVVRPSIVMGESDSGWTPAFNVLYWPLRAFSRGLSTRSRRSPTAASTWCRSTTSPTGSCTCSTAGRAGCSTSSPVTRRRPSPTCCTWAPSASTARGPSSRSPAGRAPSPTARSTCPTSTCA